MTFSKAQQNFIDVMVHHPKVKQCISSKHEFEFKKILSAIGQEGKDWFHQKCYEHEETKLIAVADFAFPEENLIIELDGTSHNGKQKKELDIKRDTVFYYNDHIVIRIKVPLDDSQKVYWKVYIEELVKILREEKKEAKSKTKIRINKKEFEKRLRMLLNG